MENYNLNQLAYLRNQLAMEEIRFVSFLSVRSSRRIFILYVYIMYLKALFADLESMILDHGGKLIENETQDNENK